MIPLPWLIIGWLASSIAIGGVAWVKGGEAARNALMAAAARASDATIRRHNAHTAEDLEAARAAADRAGRQRLAAIEIRHRLENEARNGSLLVCPDVSTATPGHAAGPPAGDRPVGNAAVPPGPPDAAGGPVRLSPAGMRIVADAVALYNAATGAAGGSGDAVPDHPGARPEPGPRRGSPPAAGGGDLRLSRELRGDAPRVGRVAAAAD